MVSCTFLSSDVEPKIIDKKTNNWNYFVDAIKNIELKGPSDYKLSQNTGLAFQVDGR